MEESRLKKFKKFTDKFKKFYTSNIDDWKNRIIYMCGENDELLDAASKAISFWNENLTSEDIDKFFNKYKEKALYYFELGKNSANLDEKYSLFTMGNIYFGIVETLNELSYFSDKVIEELKTKYKDDYIDAVAEIDRIVHSKDNTYIAKSKKSIDINDEAVKKYIVMKKWQDIQHDLYKEYLLKYVYDVERKIKEQFNEKYGFCPRLVYKCNTYENLMSKNIVNVDDLSYLYLKGFDKELIDFIGGKGYGLAVLNAYGINIPKTYVALTTATNISEEIKKLPKNIKYAIRSSANVEDGENNSFAGMFDSYLNVKYSDIEENYYKVKNSENNNRLKEYIKINNLEKPKIAAVIQEFILPEYSGVWIGKNKKSGILEWTKGTGDKLVSGKIIPNTEVWNDNKSNNNNCIIDKEENFVGNLLIKLQSKISNKDGTADFEWCLKDGKLVLLQYRPVTTRVNIANKKSVSSKDIVIGTPASSGIATGKIRFARKISDVTEWNEGDILLTIYTDPDWTEIMLKSSGIITAMGGFLCHAAIIAREMGIPCITGIGGDGMRKLMNEEMVTIDGGKGLIYNAERRYNR